MERSAAAAAPLRRGRAEPPAEARGRATALGIELSISIQAERAEEIIIQHILRLCAALAEAGAIAEGIRG